MAATFDVRSSNIEGGRAEDVATGEILEDRGVAGADESVCDSSVRERVWFVVFLHADLGSDGLILLLDRELRRIVRWRGSDTGSWRCQDSRPQIILFSPVASREALRTGGVWRR